MYSTPTCSRHDSHIGTPISQVEDLSKFQWSELNTNPSNIRSRAPRTTFFLRNTCTGHLRNMDAAKHKTEGLELLIAGIRSIIKQRWAVLLVYFDPESERPDLARPWSHTEWRKWDVVEFLTRFAVSYSEACSKAAKDGAELRTDATDQELLTLVNDLIDLGVAAEGAEIVIKEWERLGTMSTLSSPGLSTRDD